MQYGSLLLMVFYLSGCYENDEVILHSPHSYKGKIDVHAERPQSLVVRFKQVQTDR